MKRVLITAGPTREFIDDVRFLSNRSTGRMGLSLGRAFRRHGHAVTVLLGPTDARDPVERAVGAGVKVVDVVSARDMLAACEARFEACDIFIATAAVADYRPVERIDGKLKKEARDTLSLRLVRNPDVLQAMGERRRDDQVLVGFALEIADGERQARAKLERKHLDLCVLNSPQNFGEGVDTLVVLAPADRSHSIRGASKDTLAAELATVILRTLAAKEAHRE